MRELITGVLKRLGMYSPGAVELLMGTCAVESNFGKYSRQVGGGPALGWWQIEPNTMRDIWTNYIKHKVSLQLVLDKEFDMVRPDLCRLEHDPEYSIVIARLIYRRSPSSLPEATDIVGLAKVWKKAYNTYLGAGTVDKFIEKYNRYCI